MKVTFELPMDAEDDVVVKSLTATKEDLLTTKFAIFHKDRKKDSKAIKEHVKALDLIIKYYSLG